MLVVNKLWKVVEEGPAVSTADETDASGGGRSSEDSDRALALIGMNVADHHLPLVSRCRTAKELWPLGFALQYLPRQKPSACDSAP